MIQSQPSPRSIHEIFHRLNCVTLRAMPRIVAALPAIILVTALSACNRNPPAQVYGSGFSNPPPAREIDTASRLRIAQAAEASGNFDIAMSMYGAAAAAAPERADVQARFAASLARAGQVARAEEILTRALERHPNDVDILIQLGRVRLRNGAAEPALDLFGRALARAPRNADALDGRGIAFDLLDRPAEAQQSYLAARDLAPQDMRITSNLAFSYLLEGRAREARDVLEPFAGRSDMPTRMRTSLAISRSMTGDREGAMALLGSDVTTQDLDQLVASLPGARGAARGRVTTQAPVQAPSARQVAATAPAPGPGLAAPPARGGTAEAPVAVQALAPAGEAGPADAAPADAFRPFDQPSASPRRPAAVPVAASAPTAAAPDAFRPFEAPPARTAPRR